jgi:hypothetical protein
MLTIAAGAVYNAWSRRIGTYVTEFGELQMQSVTPGAELAGDACAEHREHARAIIAASKNMDTLGTGWNKGAHDAMCALCRDTQSDSRFPRYNACLAGIRRALQCKQRHYYV